jgi:putative endopeptidase
MKKYLYSVLIICLFFKFSFLKAQDNGTYFLSENIDNSYSPADNFFMYANGTFIKNHPIPPSEHTYGIFNLVEDSVYVYLQNICKDAMVSSDAPKGSNFQKIGDFYFSGLDTVTIEKAKIFPLKEWFDQITLIKDKKGVIELAAEMHKYGISPIFSFFVGQDLMQSDKYAVYLYQGGIGLPEREYYFKDDSRTQNIRKEYLNHISNIFSILKDGNSSKISDLIFKLETDLAKASRKLEDLRDDYKNYNKMTVKDLTALSPSVDWKNIFDILGVKNTDTIIVGQPEFFKEIESALQTYSIDDWKTYLKWNLIRETASLLNNEIRDENFNFYGKVLSGTTEQRPRWKSVMDNTDNMLGEILGMEYVRLYFPPEDKVRTIGIVNNMVDAFASRIKKLDWMSEDTKGKALKKLGTMVKKIGYPDVWKDYSTLEISREAYVVNVLNARNWHYNDMVSRIGKPVDRTEWDMTPQTYNAYYNPSNNEIVIPAAILTVPGKKMSEVDDAFLYGFIGASTIGHEMTHGFDDQGRLYDEKGNLKGWWTSEDSSKFVVKSQLMVEQFDNYVVLDSMHINGKATLGENIADLGGLVIGYEAMKLTEDGKKNEKIGGFTADQRYFLGYAYSWAVYYRDETLARRVMTDVHSPAFLRVNAPMSNMNEFYSAFNVNSDNSLFRANNIRIQIW